MSVSLTTLHESDDRLSGADTHDVMCLVKRRTYELMFAVPHAPQAQTCSTQPRVYVRVKTSCQAAGFTLELPDVERLYEDLLQMLEYVQHEHRRPTAPKPL